MENQRPELARASHLGRSEHAAADKGATTRYFEQQVLQRYLMSGHVVAAADVVAPGVLHNWGLLDEQQNCGHNQRNCVVCAQRIGA